MSHHHEDSTEDANQRVRAVTGVEPNGVFDHDKIRRATRMLLEAIGEDPDREGLRDTPDRVAREFDEIFAGLLVDPREILSVVFEESYDEMVMERDIPFFSVCVPSKQTVNTTRGAVKAADVAPGDELWTFDERGRLTTTRVLTASWRHAHELVEVEVGTSRLRLTPDHPVLTRPGWAPAGSLQPGDEVRWIAPRHLCMRRYPVHEGYWLGYVIGAVGSDASVQDGRRIALVVKDHEFAEKFQRGLKHAFEIDAAIEEIDVPSGFLDRDIPMYRVRVVSRHLASMLLHWYGGSKATRDFHFPLVVLRSKAMMEGFLDGYCDGDGHAANDGSKARIVVSANHGFLVELGTILAVKPNFRYDFLPGQVRIPNRRADPVRGRPGFHPQPDELVPPDAAWTRVGAVRRVLAKGTKPYRVYSFACDPHPTFLVGGVQTHNCEHHLVPFVGRAHVAYIPNEKGQITGLSKLVRLVDVVAKRPNLQERMTTQIADVIDEVLQPRGVLVVIEARHMCMEMRGIRKPGVEAVTSTVRGIFREDPRTRFEAMSLLGGHHRTL